MIIVLKGLKIIIKEIKVINRQFQKIKMELHFFYENNVFEVEHMIQNVSKRSATGIDEILRSHIDPPLLA